MTDRIFVIGDIGGHLDVFQECLTAAGVRLDTCKIPKGTIVVQVGDLVHKGPSSEECVLLADKLMQTNPESYIQLWGNHEGHYLGGPSVTGRVGVTEVSTRTQDILARWWDEKSVRLAVAVEGKRGKDALITHGGLAAGLWEDLGSPSTVQDAAQAVNSLLDDPAIAFRPGCLLTGAVDFSVGVTYARTGAELAHSWVVRGEMPFNQIHGHEGTWLWTTQDWHSDVPLDVRKVTGVYDSGRFSIVKIGDKELVSVDWVLGVVATQRTWMPWKMLGAVVAR